MPSPLDMPKRNPSPAALKQIEELLGLTPADRCDDNCEMCNNLDVSKSPADLKQTNVEKKQFVRQPHLTERPLKNHAGLADLKASLTRNEIAQEV